MAYQHELELDIPKLIDKIYETIEEFPIKGSDTRFIRGVVSTVENRGKVATNKESLAMIRYCFEAEMYSYLIAERDMTWENH